MRHKQRTRVREHSAKELITSAPERAAPRCSRVADASLDLPEAKLPSQSMINQSALAPILTCIAVRWLNH